MRKLSPCLAAAAAAILSGVLEMRQSDLLLTVAFILLAGLAIGMIWWRQSWKYGFIVGLGVPLAYIFEPVFGYHLGAHAMPSTVITFAALLPGVTGAATGAMLRITHDEGKSKR